MPKKSGSIQVVPGFDGGWVVKHSGSDRASGKFATQSQALGKAITKARHLGSEVVIHKKDGTIRDRSSYGSDPHPPHDKSARVSKQSLTRHRK
jgi:hypothetical protein